jgi:hypothetical protein
MPARYVNAVPSRVIAQLCEVPVHQMHIVDHKRLARIFVKLNARKLPMF